MTRVRYAFMAGALLVVAACGGGGQPTTAPTSQPTGAPSATAGATPTAATPTDVPTTPAEPTASAARSAPSGASLDPSQSDAGIAARVTITNDTRGGRDGTHEIYGVDEDGSECSGSFEEPDFIVIAWYDDAPDGMIHQFGVSVGADDVPTADGSTTEITDGGVSFDFASESGFGTLYSGNSTVADSGSSTIDVTRSGSTLTFDFEGVTSNNVNFAGQFVCADA